MCTDIFAITSASFEFTVLLFKYLQLIRNNNQKPIFYTIVFYTYMHFDFLKNIIECLQEKDLKKK